jgi:hypothetical protein
VGRDFLESFDPRDANHSGVVVDGELRAIGGTDFLSVKKPDDEHDGFSFF